jgi:hypothetical protein
MPEGYAGEEGLTSISLIIPPVKRKEYDYYGELFGGLWSQAEEALSRAEAISIIGYSFPETDTQSQNLFKRAMAKRKRHPRISITNPNPEHAVRVLRDICGIPGSRINVRRTFFEADFDQGKLFL